MPFNLSVFHFLIYAAGIGFAVAIVYTNIQRTAYSKFFTYLIENKCFSEENAKSLDDIGLSKIEKKLISSAVKHQYGFKKYVKSVGDNDKSGLEAAFEGRDTATYFLENADTELLRKKYTFKTMPTLLVIAFIAALALVVVIASSSVSWLIDTVTTPKLEENKEQTSETKSENSNPEGTIPEFTVPDNTDTPAVPVPDTDDYEADGPRIPV